MSECGINLRVIKMEYNIPNIHLDVNRKVMNTSNAEEKKVTVRKKSTEKAGRKLEPIPEAKTKEATNPGPGSLVEELLAEIYGCRGERGAGDRLGGDSEACTSTTSEPSHIISETELQNQSTAELEGLRSALRGRSQQAGGQLARRLCARDSLRRRRRRLCSAITIALKKFKPMHGEGDMRFSVSPRGGASGWAEWLRAMRLVARLPAGVPAEFRKKLWLTLAEQHLKVKGVDWTKAEKTCFSEWTNPDDTELGIQIVKDLHRTGCSLFCGSEGRENQAVLKRVLLAYARWNKAVGYCQGFNMLAALILEVMDRSEGDSLKVMIYLIEAVLPEGYFANNLRGLSVDMAVFRDLLRLRLPRLSAHLDKLQKGAAEGSVYEPPLTNVFTMQWFLTLFCNCLPHDTVLRVWDLAFLEGDAVLLTTALAIWDTLQDRILKVESADEFYSVMGELARETLEAPPGKGEQLLAAAARLGPVPELPRLRDKHRYNIAPWTHTVQSAAKKGLRLFYSEDETDSSDDGDKLALTTAYGLQSGGSGRGRGALMAAGVFGHPDRERLALDISALKHQYERLRERQRQAHIILAAACARQPHVGVSSPPGPISMNHLLLGKSAIVSNRGRRLGPPQGAVPPSRAAKTPKNLAKTSTKLKSETLHWKDENTKKVLSRRDSIKWRDVKQPTMQSEEADEDDPEETGNEITESELNEIMKSSMRSRGKSESSTYSECSESSTSTSLCDEPNRMSDFDSEAPSGSENNAGPDDDTIYDYFVEKNGTEKEKNIYVEENLANADENPRISEFGSYVQEFEDLLDRTNNIECDKGLVYVLPNEEITAVDNISIPDINTNRVGEGELCVGMDSIRMGEDSIDMREDSIRIGEDTIRMEKDINRMGEDPIKMEEDIIRMEKDTIRIGEDPIMMGEDIIRMGTDTIRMGENPIKMGENPIKMEDDIFRMEKETIKMIEDPSKMGEDTIKMEKDTIRIAEDPINMGEDTIRMGKDTIKMGEELFRVEKETIRMAEDPIKMEEDITNESETKLDLTDDNQDNEFFDFVDSNRGKQLRSYLNEFRIADCTKKYESSRCTVEPPLKDICPIFKSALSPVKDFQIDENNTLTINKISENINDDDSVIKMISSSECRSASCNRSISSSISSVSPIPKCDLGFMEEKVSFLSYKSPCRDSDVPSEFSEDEKPIVLKIDKYFEHSPEFFGARKSGSYLSSDEEDEKVTNKGKHDLYPVKKSEFSYPNSKEKTHFEYKNNNHVHRKKNIESPAPYDEHDDDVFHNVNKYGHEKNAFRCESFDILKSPLTQPEMILAISPLPESSRHRRISSLDSPQTIKYLMKQEANEPNPSTVIKHDQHTKLSFLEKTKSEELPHDQKRSFSVLDDEIEASRSQSGRRNSERALKIIQENSKILHRILINQVNKCTKRDSFQEEQPLEEINESLEKTFVFSNSKNHKYLSSPRSASLDDHLFNTKNVTTLRNADYSKELPKYQIHHSLRSPVTAPQPKQFQEEENVQFGNTLSDKTYTPVRPKSFESPILCDQTPIIEKKTSSNHNTTESITQGAYVDENKTDMFGWENKGFCVKQRTTSSVFKDEIGSPAPSKTDIIPTYADTSKDLYSYDLKKDSFKTVNTENEHKNIKSVSKIFQTDPSVSTEVKLHLQPVVSFPESPAIEKNSSLTAVSGTFVDNSSHEVTESHKIENNNTVTGTYILSPPYKFTHRSSEASSYLDGSPKNSKISEMSYTHVTDNFSRVTECSPTDSNNRPEGFKFETSQSSDMFIISSSMSFSFEPSVDDQPSSKPGTFNSSDTLCQLTSLDQVSTPLSPKVPSYSVSKESTGISQQDLSLELDRFKLSSEQCSYTDSYSACAASLRTPTSPTSSQDRFKPLKSPEKDRIRPIMSPETVYNPFPGRLLARQPKELGLHLGLYKDPIKSPSK